MPSLPYRSIPVYFLVDDQIEYVTDNERDAEALSCNTGRRVVVSKNRMSAVGETNVSNVSDVQTFETPGRPAPSDVPDVLLRTDSLGVPDVQESETFQSFRNVSDVADVSDVSSIDL